VPVKWASKRGVEGDRPFYQIAGPPEVPLAEPSSAQGTVAKARSSKPTLPLYWPRKERWTRRCRISLRLAPPRQAHRGRAQRPAPRRERSSVPDRPSTVCSGVRPVSPVPRRRILHATWRIPARFSRRRSAFPRIHSFIHARNFRACHQFSAHACYGFVTKGSLENKHRPAGGRNALPASDTRR
jgi:hypothetical protein